MRRYGMYDASRGLTLALAAALAGLGLWGATQIGMQTTGRFWLSMLIVAGAGFVIAVATHVGTWTKGLRLRMSPSTFALAFLPVLIVGGWILVATQPGNGWQERRLHSWSDSIGILGVVHSIGLWHGVLAFAIGLMLGLSLDGVPAPAEEAEAAPAYEGTAPAADEPVAAERRYANRPRPATPPAETPAEERTQTRTRIPSR
ncbi:MAG TPA: hypothetical protein VGI69_03935 [Gaiellaceae bacterium]|jgi:hypothetical protein